MKTFSTAWISSKKPNKQRKYRFNAPLSIRGDFLNVHLSKELKQKHNVRALRVRVGDKVRIMRGQFKTQEGKVEEVNLKKLKIYIEKIGHVKRDGSKARYPIDPSNLLLVELNTDDKLRLNKPKKSETQPKVVKVAKPKVEAKLKADKPKTATKSKLNKTSKEDTK
jgi:large subunit ribosomal protein L24